MPDYILRYSNKAKYLQLRLSIRGLEVVVPAKKPVAIDFIEQFIQKKQAWIEQARQRYLTQTEHYPPVLELPTTLHLQAINQKWEVIYLSTQSSRVNLIANACHQIKLIGNTANHNLCFKLLRQWLKKMAEPYLFKELTLLSIETGLTFKTMNIRNNMTRWGSCNSQKKISLCCKLLFLPPSLMRHVLLHELCHTKVMNHGKEFWKLLEQFDKSAKIHAQQLKLAATHIPLWVSIKQVFH